ncbi:MAG: hypothetical protein KDA24_04420 [Deltaproteobacteria bacterium]|nr:hypothetical protein [Deltaproteobacteria bacterium]
MEARIPDAPPLRRHFAVPLLAVLAVLLAAAPADAQRRSALENDLSLVESEVAGLEQRFNGLQGEISAGSLSRSPRISSERYDEALYAFVVEDYERCALLFFSLIENEDLKGDQRLPRAEWNLAQCLFLDGNFIPAQARFKNIVDQGATHPFHGDSLLKLIEIYGRTGNVSLFNQYYNTFVRSSQDGSPTSLRIRYEMGKTLFFQEKLPESQAIFAAFPRGSTYTPQAHYFSGAILVQEGRNALEKGDEDLATQKYRQALVKFQETLGFPRSTEDHERVKDLCNLAIARLHYERGEVPDAIMAYAKIGAGSLYYADALYERIWANIESAAQEEVELRREQRYGSALDAIEIFNLSFPNDVREPALRLLGGHVRVKMASYDDAIAEYGDASRHFEDVKVLVGQIVTSGADPMVYFNQLVDDERFVAEADLTVPSAAVRKAKEDERVGEAVRISGDLYRQQDDIDDADDLLDLLERALSESASRDLLQVYRLHRQQVSSTDAAGVLLRQRLVDIELRYFEENLPSSAQSGVDAIRASGNAATVLADAQRRAQERVETLDMQAQAVATRLYHVELASRDILDRLLAVEEYMVGARNRGERTRDQELELRGEINEERRDLQAALQDLHELRKRLSPRVLTGRLLIRANEDLRARQGDAVAELDSKEAQLRDLRRSAGSSAVLSKVDDLRARLLRLDTSSGALKSRLDEAEATEVAAIKLEVSRQRTEVTGLAVEGDEIGDENTRVSGRIGKNAFVNVVDFYEDMLTRADMGVADVYWYRKESLSQEKRSLARESNIRLRILQDAFSDVLEEEE